MKKSLYHIEQEYLEIIEALSYDELTPELEQALSITQDELQTKAINYGFVIRESEGNVSIINEEIKRLTALKKSEERKVERLKESISNAMTLFGVEKVESPVLKLSFRASESVEVVNESQLPDEYFTTKIVKSVDKKKIKDAISNGETVEGAVLKKNNNLQIK